MSIQTPEAPARALPLVIGRYRVLELLGRGAMGTVYRAEDPVLQRIVALKTVPRPAPGSAAHELEAHARFVREARVAGRLAHPGIVTIYDVGDDRSLGQSYIAMELVDGEPLDRLIARGLPFDPDQVRAIGHQVASALAAAHDGGIVHRDIKPANLLRTTDGRVKVADFGIAKLASAAMTLDGTLLGSPAYMSPEQVRGRSVDAGSDIYSLGAVLYELVSGRPAFPGTHLLDVLRRVEGSKVEPLARVCPGAPADLVEVVTRAMQPEPADRFPSARAMAAALGSVPVAPIPRGALLVDVLADDLIAVDVKATGASADGRSAWRVRAPGWVAAAVVVSIVAAGLARVAANRAGTTHAEPPSTAVATVAGSAVNAGGMEPLRVPPASASPSASTLTTPSAGAVVPGAKAPRRPPTRKVKPVVATAATQVADPPPAATRPGVAATGLPPMPRLPAVYRVEHAHRIGGCSGELTVWADHLAYDSTTDGEDRALQLDQLRWVSFANGSLEIVIDERDGASLGLRHRRYRFRLGGVALPDGMLRHIGSRVRDRAP